MESGLAVVTGASAGIGYDVTGTLHLVHNIGRVMRDRGAGRILIAGMVPGAHHAVYNASKAFLDSFSFALRD